MRSARARPRSQGSLMLEAVLLLCLIIIPGMAFQLELIRVAQNHIGLQVSAFYFVRHRALGAGHAASADFVKERFSKLFPSAERNQFANSAAWEGWRRRDPREVWGRVTIRYQTWFKYLQDRRQITKTCWFSW